MPDPRSAQAQRGWRNRLEIAHSRESMHRDPGASDLERGYVLCGGGDDEYAPDGKSMEQTQAERLPNGGKSFG